MPEKKLAALGNLLGGALVRHGIQHRIEAAQIVATTNELLRDLLRADQQVEIQAVSFKDSELLLACKTPSARYAAEGLTNILTQSLESRYPGQTIRRIHCVFRTGKASDDEWYNGASI